MQIKLKNLLNRLNNFTRHPAQLPPMVAPPASVPPLIPESKPLPTRHPVKRPAPIQLLKPEKPNGTSKTDIEDYEFKKLQCRLTQKLQAKGVKITPITTTHTRKAKPKGGLMDNIGTILECPQAPQMRPHRKINIS